MESTRQRIRYFIENQGIKPKDFLKVTGQKRGLLDKSLASHGVTDHVIAQILECYPSLSPMWLISGKGDMLTTKSIEKSIQNFERNTKDNDVEPEAELLLNQLTNPDITHNDLIIIAKKIESLLRAKNEEISMLKTELLDLYRKIQKLEL